MSADVIEMDSAVALRKTRLCASLTQPAQIYKLSCKRHQVLTPMCIF